MKNQYVIDKWEGKNLKDNVGNRISGLAMLVFGGVIALTTDNTLLDIGGCAFAMEGLGDLLSGQHHYISSRLFKFHPKYKKENN